MEKGACRPSDQCAVVAFHGARKARFHYAAYSLTSKTPANASAFLWRGRFRGPARLKPDSGLAAKHLTCAGVF